MGEKRNSKCEYSRENTKKEMEKFHFFAVSLRASAECVCALVERKKNVAAIKATKKAKKESPARIKCFRARETRKPTLAIRISAPIKSNL